MTSQDYLDNFANSLKIKSRSERTHENYLGHLSRFINSFPHQISKATTAQLTEYILNSGGASTMAQVHTTLNLFYTHVLKQKNKVARWIPYPDKTKYIPKVPTHLQILEMIAGQTNNKHRLIIRLLYATGIRVSELVNLRWSDVQRREGINPLSIHVRGKGKKDRLVPLSKETNEMLVAYCHEFKLKCDSKTHFIFGDSHPYSVRSVELVVKRAGMLIGFDNLTPHKLRHAYGFEQRKSGIDLGRLQELMGHSSLETTRIYSGVDNLEAKVLL